MKHLPLTILVLASLSTSAWAQTGPGQPGATPQWRAQRNLVDGNRGMVPNANLCGAEMATAVWGADSAPLGYRCWTNSNGS